jgi:hypothetical protein
MLETVSHLAITPPTKTVELPPSAGLGARTPGVVLPGHRFLARVCTGPVAEVWKVETADGRQRLAKLLYGFARQDPAGEAAAVSRLSGLRHPALVPLEVVQHDPGRLVVLADAVETSLGDHYHACRAQGQPGVPRHELLGWLRSAAETLDGLAREHGLQHLGLNPRTLLLQERRLLIADFGLVQLLWAPAGQPVAELNARYAAPELFRNIQGNTCDQYSLALIYHEMLTGAHPTACSVASTGRDAGGRARDKGRPDLQRLPPAEREVLARALQRDPQRRWGSCTELFERLEAAAAVRPNVEKRRGSGSTLNLQVAANPALKQIITELLAGAAVHSQLQRGRKGNEAGSLCDTLGHRFTARVPRAGIRQKLDLLRQQWNGQALREENGLYVFQVVRSLSFWQRCIGRQAGLEIWAEAVPSVGPSAATTEVVVEIRPFGCRKEQGAELLDAIGPLLLESAATCLHATAERRVQKRLPWPYPLRIRFVLPNHELGEPITCRGKDISLTGVGFYQPPQLPTKQLAVELTTPFQEGVINLPANVVRVQRCGDGWYEVGAAFV